MNKLNSDILTSVGFAIASFGIYLTLNESANPFAITFAVSSFLFAVFAFLSIFFAIRAMRKYISSRKNAKLATLNLAIISIFIAFTVFLLIAIS